MLPIMWAFRQPGLAVGQLVLAGVLLAAGTAVRPSASATLVCALVLLLAPRRPWPRGVLQLALILAAGTVTWVAYQGLLLRVYRQTPPAVGWYNLMVGLNFETRGQHSTDDSRAYFAFPTAAQRDEFARATAYRRASENVARLPWLVRRKMLVLWGTDHDSVKWSTSCIPPSCLSAASARAVIAWSWAAVGTQVARRDPIGFDPDQTHQPRPA